MKKHSLLLWALLALFVLRVAGQALVAFFVMVKICADFTRQRGFFFAPKRFLAWYGLWFGYPPS